MKRISQRQWRRYENIVNEFHDDANQTPIIWRKAKKSVPRFGENVNTAYEDIELKGLIQYNTFRTWPITQFTQLGNEDKQSEVLLLNIEYLKRSNLLDSNGNFSFDTANDEFIHNGIRYEHSGDTLHSQTNNKALFFMIILKRKNNETTQAP